MTRNVSDLYTLIINQEYQIDRLLKIVDIIIDRTGVEITEDELNKINDDALSFVQRNHPNSGIHYNPRGIYGNKKS